MATEVHDNISIDDRDDRLSIIIDGKLPRANESLLLAWLVVWVALGAYVMYELRTVDYERDIRLALNIYLALWAYFLFKIGKAFLWSRAGQERVILVDGQLSIKTAIYGYGRSQAYPVENITDMKVSELSKRSVQYQLESSFWVIGGERIDFGYMGRRLRFGRKIDDKLAQKIVKRMKVLIKQMKRKAETASGATLDLSLDAKGD